MGRDGQPDEGTQKAQRGSIVVGLVISAAVTAISWAYSDRAAAWQPVPHVVDAVARSTGYADETRCAECHDEANEFHLTGHAQTLHRASDQFSLDKLSQIGDTLGAEANLQLELIDGQPHAVAKSDDIERSLELDWCFGSGTHANTWTSTLSDSRGTTDLLEFRWTWFREIDGFSFTPGQRGEVPADSITAIGVQFDGPKAQRCLSCHATVVPNDDGEILDDAVHPGVTCQRCHGPLQDHVASDGAPITDGWKPSDEITQLESVMRCGVCHRMSEERDPHEIRAGNIDIVRFQPMGLLESECFKNSEMTCTTCHDPHKPMAAQDAGGIWQCVQCHDSNNTSHTTCGAGMTEGCMECHMPAISMEFPVAFTDHWIRVREPPEKADR